MKMYELDADAEGPWVWFELVSGSNFPLAIAEAPSFFASKQCLRIVRSPDQEPKKIKRVLSDMSTLGTAAYPCVSQRFKDVLGPYLEDLVQWLPVDFDEAPYWIFNVTNIVDAVDVDKSEIKYFTSSGRAMEIKEFSFHPEKLKGQLIFRPEQCSGRYNLVTEAFVDLVHEHRLTGFRFRLLWSSEEGPVSSKLKYYDKPWITGLEPR